ncbi:MAG: hypothetical protein IH899_22350 [Planctomycetes bacterium]|nr:hypothetical protein [Planctomycetota bacterium]
MVRITVCALLLGSVGIVAAQFAVYSLFAGEQSPMVKLLSDEADVSKRNSKGKNHSFSPFSSVPRWTDEIRIYRAIIANPAHSKDFVDDVPSRSIFSSFLDPYPTKTIEIKSFSLPATKVMDHWQYNGFGPYLIDQWIKAR